MNTFREGKWGLHWVAEKIGNRGRGQKCKFLVHDADRKKSVENQNDKVTSGSNSLIYSSTKSYTEIPCNILILKGLY